MKRTMTLLLAVLLLIGCTGCSTSTGFIMGTTGDNIYENAYLGIGCELPDTWTFYTREEIAELNNITYSALDDDMAKQLEDAQIIYDMYASDALASSVVVTVENLGIAGLVINTVEEYIELSTDASVDALKQIGFSDVTYETTSVLFAGETHPALKLVCDHPNGFSFYETIVCLKVDNYVASITIGAIDEGTVESLINAFYAV